MCKWRCGRQSSVTDPGPITWALDLLAAHNIPALGEDEDPHRLLGELLSLGWDVSFRDAPPYEVRGQVAWLPVGQVRFVVTGETFAEAVLFALAMALDLQEKR